MEILHKGSEVRSIVWFQATPNSTNNANVREIRGPQTAAELAGLGYLTCYTPI